MRDRYCNELKQISFTCMDGIYNVWDLAQKVIDEGIEGDMAEAGVSAGANPILMALVCKKNQSGKRVHMLDSFCGHPQALDYEHEDIKKNYGTRNDGDELRNNVLGNKYDVDNAKRWSEKFGVGENMEYHVGFYQDTLPNLPDFKLSLLRLDVNMLESHLLCMEYLYPRLVKGGYFISDDYSSVHIRPLIDKMVKDNGLKPTVIGDDNNVIWWKK